ncbi:MAG: hypothetical protein KDE51_13635 [Anaerolineales bacterium]|nr:hypothetical protein [Anaerolineales bacterium]
MERPDLTDVDETIVAYIEYLEAELADLASEGGRSAAPIEPSEPETTINVVTLSQGGRIKRTPRHFYSRQRRGGMGIFEIDLPEDDAPLNVVLADVNDEVIVISSFARVFHLPLSKIPETEVRAKGVPITNLVNLHANETVATILAGDGGSRIASLTPRGYVFTSNKPSARDGDFLYNTHNQGGPIACCWTSGDDDIFIATKQGQAIRFDERQVPKGGCLGIRLDTGDELLGITATNDEGGVFLLSYDGKGTVRLMEGFRKNKAPGAGGKVAMKTDNLVAAVAVEDADDIFIISQLGKMIRFSAEEVPAKTGVVQGVNCMSLRNDETAAVGIAKL